MTAPINTSADQQWLSDISAGAGIVGGLEKGGTSGDIQAAGSAAKLASNTGVFSKAANNTVGELGNAYGIYAGIEQGGVVGYGSAAVNAGQLAERLGVLSSSTPAGEAIPVLGAALGVYNFAANWQSGATGADALRGAEAGAAIGSVVPVVGTIAGAVIGGVIGAVSSAFGGGETDPETKNWQSFVDATGGANATAAQVAAASKNMSPQAAFNLLAGVMDIKDGRIPIVNAFGRMGEGSLLTQMTSTVNQAIKAGKVSPTATPAQIYSQVVQPWLNSKGATITPETGGLQLQSVLTSLIGSWQSGALTNKTILDSGGSADTNLQAFAAAGVSNTHKAAQTTVQQNIAPLQTAVLTMPGLTGGSSAASMLPLMLAMPAIFGGVNAMADPNNPAGGVSTSDPTLAASIGAGTQPGSVSSSSGILSDIGSFLSSPGGSLLEAGAVGAIGMSQANAQKGQNDALASSLAAPGAPFTAAGQAELGQITGGPAVGGPLGASITQQTQTATELGNVAKEYSTGNLTSAQSQQVQDYIAQQRAMVDTQLAASGTSDSSARQAAYQQIDDNAAKLTQSLTDQNIQTGTAALTAVQGTYSNLLNQALSSSEFGFSTELAAVQTQIQADTALAASLNQLFAGIASGYGNAVGGGANRAAGSAASAVGSAVGAASRGVASSASGGDTSQGSAAGNAAEAQPGSFNSGDTPEEVAATTPGGNPEQFAPESGFPADPTSSLDTFTTDSSGASVLSDFGGDPFGGLS